MGDVYLAVHSDLGKTVAIKIMPPDLTRNEELIQRFRREAESAARLDHPNLVEIYDVGEESGYHYLVMAYVEGRNLQELCDEMKRLDPREAVRIGYEVARGLEAVHAEGIIHRDIKPANILISSKAEVKIVDFGLAFDAEDKTTLTVAGSIMGTPWYLSPEQAEGKRSDARSDLYSLGICLYLMICGVRPFVGETHMSVLFKQIHEKPKDPRLLVPGLPDYLAELILRALEKKPEKRFATAAEFGAALEAFLKGTHPRKAPATKIGSLKPADPEPRPARRGIASKLSLVALAVIAAAVLALGLRGAAPPSDAGHAELVKQAALAEVRGDPAAAKALYEQAAALRETPEVREGLDRIASRPAPVLTKMPDIFVNIAEEDRKRIAARDYAPVLKKLLERHQAAASPAEKAALARLGLQLSSALRVAGKSPTGEPAEAVVDRARKSRDVTELDLAFFLLAEGRPLAALDCVIAGRDVRPDCRAHLDDLVELALSGPQAREAAERLQGVRARLSPRAAARVDAARR
jgi:predicted Ser/Thr protein kinase